MDVTVVTEAKFDLLPSIAENLKRIPSSQLYHARYQLRHPAGLYHISLDRLADRFRRILDFLEDISSKFGATSEPPDLDDTIERTEALLRSVMEHIEDCNSILFSLFPSKKAAKCHMAVRQFGREIDPYREQVAKIVNAIKHRGGRIRPVFMHWNSDYAPGYFVEGALDDGIIGPDDAIHNGGDTAISIFRDIKLHFVMIFLVGASLEKAITQLVTLDTPSVDNGPERRLKEFRYRELARRISLLPNTVFPDELTMPFPLIRLLRADDFGCEAEFSYKVGATRVFTFGKFKLRVSWGGDGVADTFKLPYWRTGWQKDILPKTPVEVRPYGSLIELISI